ARLLRFGHWQQPCHRGLRAVAVDRRCTHAGQRRSAVAPASVAAATATSATLATTAAAAAVRAAVDAVTAVAEILLPPGGLAFAGAGVGVVGAARVSGAVDAEDGGYGLADTGAAAGRRAMAGSGSASVAAFSRLA